MIARYLKDFSPPKLPAVTEMADDGLFDFPGLSEAEPMVDMEELRESAHAEGVEQGRHEAETEYVAALAEERERNAATIAAMKTHYEEEIAALVAARLGEMAGTIARDVAEATANAIAPLMGEALARRAVADLAAMLRAVIEEGGVARARVRGPQEACRRLAAELGEERAQLVEFETGEDMDLTVEAGSSVLVTRLGVFAAELERAMA